MPTFEQRQKAGRIAGSQAASGAGIAAGELGALGVGAAFSVAIKMRAIYKTEKHITALKVAYQTHYGESPLSYNNEPINDVRTAIRYAINKKDLKSAHKAAQISAVGGGVIAGAIVGSVVPGPGTILGGAAIGGATFAVSTLSVYSYRALHRLSKGSKRGVHRQEAAVAIWGATRTALTTAPENMSADQKMASFACLEMLNDDFYLEAIKQFHWGDKNAGEGFLFGKLQSW